MKSSNGVTEESISWLREAFKGLLQLPWNRGSFFNRIWSSRRLQYDGDARCFDLIDNISARLVFASVDKANAPLLIALPDKKEHRGSGLLSAALIYSALKSIDEDRKGRNALYLGESAGIRSHLSAISVRNVSLATVFEQTYGSGTLEKAPRELGHLPSLSVVYAPNYPGRLIGRYQPRWVAVDVDKASKVEWLPQVISICDQDKIPLIAWTCNPLSNAIEAFKDSEQGMIFNWPQKHLSNPNIRADDIEGTASKWFAKSNESPGTTIQPLGIEGDEVAGLSTSLTEAQRGLAQLMSEAGASGLARDGVAVGWRLLRSLERLSVPISVYEGEAGRHWGVRKLRGLRDGLESFVRHLQKRDEDVGRKLAEVHSNLERAFEHLRSGTVPRWEVLVELCLDDKIGIENRVLVFPSKAQKDIFTFALLSVLNTSVEELGRMGVELASIQGLSDAIDSPLQALSLESPAAARGTGSYESKDAATQYVLTGVPTSSTMRKIGRLLQLQEFSVVIYRAELGQLKRRVEFWNEQLSSGYGWSLETVARLSNVTPPEHPESPPRVVISDPESVQGRPTPSWQDDVGPSSSPQWRHPDLEEELDYLDSTAFSPEKEQMTEGSEFRASDGRPAVKKRVLVEFNGPYRGLFAPDDQVNVYDDTASAESGFKEQYVRALRNGDRILYIHGARRQTLYNIIVERYHSHPAIRFHLSFLENWRRELRQRVAVWEESGRTIAELLGHMREMGSRISSVQTIESWINGQTLRPQDDRDIKRLANILGMSFSESHWQRIAAAGSRIHGLHIDISRNLNRWIERRAAGEDVRETVLIDDEAQIYLSDITDLVSILTVEAVTVEDGLFDRDNLGKVVEIEDRS